MLYDGITPHANFSEPDARLQNPDEGSRPKRRCTKMNIVVINDYPRRCTVKLVNHEDFKNFLDYVRRIILHVVEVGEKLDLLLLQGGMQHKHFMLVNKECIRGCWKENMAATDWVVQLLNMKRYIVY